MKRMKKILSILLSVVMVMAMGITAFADGEGGGQTTLTTPTYTVTINNATGDYAIYQVFLGDLSVDSTEAKKLSNVVWGKDVNAFEFTTKDATTSAAAEEGTDATKIAEYLATKSNDSEVAKNFAATAIAHVKENLNSGTATATNGTAKFAGLAAGYYVVKNTSVKTSESYTEYILQVVGDVTVNNKADVPSSEKKVKDINDSTDITESNWQDSADYDIGDSVPFQLKGTVASNYADYTTYKFVFHDTESKGLTFNANSVKVKVDGNVINSGYEVKTSNIATGETFNVVFENLKSISSVHAGSAITVEYTSTLNKNAVLGSQGNPNTMHLEFSNNPNNTQGGDTGTTPDDTVIVFTYKLVINKVDQNNKPLTGADFKLEKQIKGKDGADDTWTEVNGKTISDFTDGDQKVTKKCVFIFSGLDDGVYKLTETVTPTGFNTIDPITFTVTADHKVVWGASDQRTDILTNLTGTKSTGEITFTADTSAGSLTANVVNKEGTILPSTGGIGTTIFYVVGAILMIGAGVVLVSRRRVNK